MITLINLRRLLLTAAVCLPVWANAQNLLGLTASPVGGTFRGYQNPAWLADSPHRFFVSLGAVNIQANNNYVRYQAPYSLLRLITGNVPSQYRQANNALRFETGYTEEILDGKPKNGTLSGQFTGPSLQLSVGPRTTVGLSTRLRAAGQLWGASEQLLSAIRASLASAAYYSIPSRNNAFSVNTNVYGELAASVGHTLYASETGKLLGGLTVKYLVGFTSGYFVNKGLDYTVLPDPNVPGGGYLDVSRIDADFGYTSFLDNQNLSLRALLNGHPPGRGVGFDVGLAYIRQADADSPTMKFGLGLTDLGAISYTAESYDITQQKIRFLPSDFNDIRNTEQAVTIFRQKLNVTEMQSRSGFSSGLPTSLNLSADYALPTGLGVQLAFWQDLRGDLAVATHQPTVMAVVPRYETKWGGVSLPLSLVNGGGQLGLALRAGPVWAGSDNLLGLIGTDRNGIRARGVDVYLGVALGVGARPEPQ